MAVVKGQHRNCVICGVDFEMRRYGQMACSYVCSYTMSNLKKKRGRTNYGTCVRCGKSLENKRGHAIYCSKTCKSMDHMVKHRSKTRVVGTARRRIIWERDNGTCYMCQAELPLDGFELDHLIPIRRNGNNAETNLAVSCMKCNRSRGTRIGVEQLLKLAELGHNFDY